MAISRGCGEDRPGMSLVTVDKADFSGPGLKALAHVRRVLGDSTAETTVERVKAVMSAPVDLLYIDSKHTYEHTMANLKIYREAFDPRVIILDDIRINPEMEDLWREVSREFRDQSFDASELADRSTGFGVIFPRLLSDCEINRRH